MDTLENQVCPACGMKKLSLAEDVKDIPHFGKTYLFSMRCSNCDYNKSDVESEERKSPSKYVVTINNEKDLNIKIVKSSEATVKIPQLKMSMTPGPGSIGFISNIEGLLDKFVEILESTRDNAEDDSEKKTAKNLLKKIRKVKFGDIPLKIIIEDPSGNSAIISDKAEVKKL